MLGGDNISAVEKPANGPNRRRFLGQMGGAAATFAAGALATSSGALAAENDNGGTLPPAGLAHKRVRAAFKLRVGEAKEDALVPAAVNINNGDEALYPDKGGAYTKGLPHDSFGRVDPNAYATFKTALTSGNFSDFENIIMGGARGLNGPQAGLCFDLDALDNAQF